MPNSSQFVEPTTLAPAARNLETATASSRAFQLPTARLPAVGVSSLMHMESLTATGTPRRGPSGSCLFAASASTLAKAFSFEVLARRIASSATARTLRSPRRMAAARANAILGCLWHAKHLTNAATGCGELLRVINASNLQPCGQFSGVRDAKACLLVSYWTLAFSPRRFAFLPPVYRLAGFAVVLAS